jgi:hypothetical protein
LSSERRSAISSSESVRPGLTNFVDQQFGSPDCWFQTRLAMRRSYRFASASRSR